MQFSQTRTANAHLRPFVQPCSPRILTRNRRIPLTHTACCHRRALNNTPLSPCSIRYLGPPSPIANCGTVPTAPNGYRGQPMKLAAWPKESHGTCHTAPTRFTSSDTMPCLPQGYVSPMKRVRCTAGGDKVLPQQCEHPYSYRDHRLEHHLGNHQTPAE
jgi:hypothetical protein